MRSQIRWPPFVLHKMLSVEGFEGASTGYDTGTLKWTFLSSFPEKKKKKNDETKNNILSG